MNRLFVLLTALAALSAQGTPASAAEEERTVALTSVHHAVPKVSNPDAQALFTDVNATRLKHGLPALEGDRRLDAFALSLAWQMAERGYFGHTDPAGVTYEDRVRAAGLLHNFAAENIALDEDEPHANAAFLGSSGHYANIIDPAARRLGTAVVMLSDGEVFFVEEFAG